MADMIVDAFMTYETIEELRKMNGEFIEKTIVYDWFSFHAYFVSREKNI